MQPITNSNEPHDVLHAKTQENRNKAKPNRRLNLSLELLQIKLLQSGLLDTASLEVVASIEFLWEANELNSSVELSTC